MELTKLHQAPYRKTQKQRKITRHSFWIPANSTQHNTLRRRAASTPPTKLGLGGSPQETGSRRSSVPRNLHLAPRRFAGLGNSNRTTTVFRARRRRPTATGEGKAHSRAPPSREYAEGGRSATELHRNIHHEGDRSHLQKPLQRRHHLHDASG